VGTARRAFAYPTAVISAIGRKPQKLPLHRVDPKNVQAAKIAATLIAVWMAERSETIPMNAGARQ
jgi:hypothetical protein